MNAALWAVGGVAALYAGLRLYLWVYAVNTRLGRDRWLRDMRRSREQMEGQR